MGGAYAQEVQFTATMSSTTCSGTLVQFDALYIPSENSVTEFDFNNGALPAGWSSSPYTVGQPCIQQKGIPPPIPIIFGPQRFNLGGVIIENVLFKP